MRSGLSAAANYAEARAAESRADFIHKLRIVLKELNENKSSLEQIMANGLFSHDKMATPPPLKRRVAGTVQSETSDFGFEVQDLSDFRFFRALDESSILMPWHKRGGAKRQGGRSRRYSTCERHLLIAAP